MLISQVLIRKIATVSLLVISSASIFGQSIIQSEFITRGNLPNFFSKLKESDTVTIAYFGGSITEAKNGWREQSFQWLSTTYPKTKFKHINAAIGGTGSDLGAFRLQQHVLAFKPDLVFIEFAVNDEKKPLAMVHETIEGIVRQIWRQDKYADICFVYTIRDTFAETWLAEKPTVPIQAMEEVAAYYQIPSIHFGHHVMNLYAAQKLVFKGNKDESFDKIIFSSDGVHPFPETGHKLYTESFTRAFTEFARSKKNKKKAHTIRETFSRDPWEDAHMLSASDFVKLTEWKKIDLTADSVGAKLKNRFTALYSAHNAGASFTVKFKGKMIGLYDVVGPGCGQYDVYSDGGEAVPFPRFDKFATYYRSNYFVLPVLEDTDHTVHFKVSPQQLDKVKILSERNQTMDDPRHYVANACYVSQILMRGKVIE